MAIDNRGGGALPLDANGNAIQSGTEFLTEDATGTPVISPFTTTNADVKTLTVPENVAACVFTPVGADIRVGENVTLDGTGTGKGYVVIPDKTSQAYPVAGMTSVFFKRNAVVDAEVSFRWERL